jgi:hypothetical protein
VTGRERGQGDKRALLKPYCFDASSKRSCDFTSSGGECLADARFSTNTKRKPRLRGAFFGACPGRTRGVRNLRVSANYIPMPPMPPIPPMSPWP